ncbi:UTP--glucose-1-phosphate uridylyltransferase 3 [Forsythia ovata]|uniref:UTP--glucose-1-phosphate uridylyltransferase 3 n=1 Tax=Forsythia ovata TaxID=205694 RepID=A0ABD1PXV6_9LAMI
MRISTAPVEYAPPSLEFNFQKEIARLKYLKSKLHDCRMLKEKMNEMESDSRVKSFFDYKSSSFARVLEWENLNENELYLLKCVVAAGQGRVFGEFGSKLKGESPEGETFHLCQRSLDQTVCKSRNVHEWQELEGESQHANPQNRPSQYFSENLPHMGIEPALPEDFSPRLLLSPMGVTINGNH